jgi:hypothetical protein
MCGKLVVSNFRRRLFITVSVFILTLLFTVLVDRITGAVFYRDAAREGLIFPPKATFSLQTAEFNCTVNINSLGFRDRELNLKKEGQTLILAVGDSFTYGWGVEGDESWPELLEARLRQEGYDVEVANLGHPGASPAEYAVDVDKAVRILKPDLVLVGMLQGEDFAQIGAEAAMRSSASVTNGPPPSAITLLRLRDRLSHIGRLMYPNFLRLMDEHTPQRLAALWKDQAEAIVVGLTPEERARFDNLDVRVKRAFLNGELNPSVIQRAMKLPRFFLDTFRDDQPEAKSAISAVAGRLAHIKEAVGRQGTEVIVVSVPHKVYASRRDLEDRRRLGYELIPEMAESDSPDRAIESACRIAGVKFISVTNEFRKAANAAHLFYEMDGHYNPKGHQVFADLLTPRLLRQWQGEN